MSLEPSASGGISSGLSNVGAALSKVGEQFGNLYLQLQQNAQAGSKDLYNSQVQAQYMRALGYTKGEIERMWATFENDPNPGLVGEDGNASYQTYPKQFEEGFDKVKDEAMKMLTLPEARAKYESQLPELREGNLRALLHLGTVTGTRVHIEDWRKSVRSFIDSGDEVSIGQWYDIAEKGQFLDADTLAKNQIIDLDLAHYNHVKILLDKNNDPSAVLSDIMRPDAEVMKKYDITTKQLEDLRDYYTDVVDKTTKMTEAKIKENSAKVVDNIVGKYAQETLTVDDLKGAAVITVGADRDKMLAMLDKFQAAQGSGFEGVIKRKQNVTQTSLLASMSDFALSADPNAKEPWNPDTLTPLVDANTIRGDQTSALMSAYNQAIKDRAGMADPQTKRAAELRNTMYKAVNSGHNPGTVLKPDETKRDPNLLGGLDFLIIENDWKNGAISNSDHDQIVAERYRLMKDFESGMGNTSEDAELYLAGIALDQSLEYPQKIKKAQDYYIGAGLGHVSGKDQVYWMEQMDPWSKNVIFADAGKALSKYYDEAIAARITAEGRESPEILKLSMERYNAMLDIQKFAANHAKDSDGGYQAVQDYTNGYVRDQTVKDLINASLRGSTAITPSGVLVSSFAFPAETHAGVAVWENARIGLARELYTAHLYEPTKVSREYQNQRTTNVLDYQRLVLGWAGLDAKDVVPSINKKQHDEFTIGGQKYVVLPEPDENGMIHDKVFKVITYANGTSSYVEGPGVR